MATNKQQSRRLVNEPANAAAERVLQEKDLGGGKVWRLAWLEEALVFNGDLFKAFTNALPANSRVRHASMNFDTLITLSDAGANKMALGLSTDPDAFALSGTVMTKNTKTDAQPVEATAILATAVTPRITVNLNTGASTGSAIGTARGRLIFEYTTQLPDAP